ALPGCRRLLARGPRPVSSGAQANAVGPKFDAPRSALPPPPRALPGTPGRAGSGSARVSGSGPVTPAVMELPLADQHLPLRVGGGAVDLRRVSGALFRSCRRRGFLRRSAESRRIA